MNKPYYTRNESGFEEIEPSTRTTVWEPWIGWRHGVYGISTWAFSFLCTYTILSSSDPMGHLSQWYYFVALVFFFLAHVSTYHHYVRATLLPSAMPFFVGSFALWAWATILLVVLTGEQMADHANEVAEEHHCPPKWTAKQMEEMGLSPFHIPTFYEMRYCAPSSLGFKIVMAFAHFWPFIASCFIYLPQYKYLQAQFFRAAWKAFLDMGGVQMIVWWLVVEASLIVVPSLVYVAIVDGKPFSQYGVDDIESWKKWTVYITSPLAGWLAQGIYAWYLYKNSFL